VYLRDWMHLRNKEKSIRKMGLFHNHFEFLANDCLSIFARSQCVPRARKFVAAFLEWVHSRYVPYWQAKWRYGWSKTVVRNGPQEIKTTHPLLSAPQSTLGKEGSGGLGRGVSKKWVGIESTRYEIRNWNQYRTSNADWRISNRSTRYQVLSRDSNLH